MKTPRGAHRRKLSKLSLKKQMSLHRRSKKGKKSKSISPAIEVIPPHLAQFVVEQNPGLYTAIDHAVWRFILHVSHDYFSENAHQKYLDGLAETGISTERIPLLSEMDAKLRKFGWRAVAVTGFIPPSAFMEFQSLRILPIACDMRSRDHLAYTPAPDIVHEAAGHAPIIADPDYSKYLQAYGEVARKAIFSIKDMDLYYAIRDLSEIKENPRSTQAEIRKAQENLDKCVAAVDYISEATYLSRMNWWTVEYGLVGNLERSRIYGAGLLSSVGESFHCLSDSVKKIPFTLDCINQSYDITRPQPQLFVTNDFEKLTAVLDEMASQMAFKKGGMEALAKAKAAQALTTTVLNSGLQISGILTVMKIGPTGEASFLKYQGPVQLSVDDQELVGHGARAHFHGFSSPIGPVRIQGKKSICLSEATKKDLKNLGLVPGKKVKMEFVSGAVVTGEFAGPVFHKGKLVLLQFHKASVEINGEIVFDEKWGAFDLACGSEVVSVFGGAADRGAYLLATENFNQRRRPQQSNAEGQDKKLCELFARVRAIRESKDARAQGKELQIIFQLVVSKYPQEWLLLLELLELFCHHGVKELSGPKIREVLKACAEKDESSRELIDRGLKAFC